MLTAQHTVAARASSQTYFIFKYTPRHALCCTALNLQVTTTERFINYHIQQCEAFRCHKLPACSAAAGRTILTHTIILDMEGLSPVKHFTLTVKRFLETISQVDQVRA